MQINLFAEETQLERLSKLGDSLERLKVVDFEEFRSVLRESLRKERKSNAGRPPFDCVMMFKVLVLQRLFNLSDEQTEYQITDRMSFQRFLGLSLGERVPDARTIWLYKDTLNQTGTMEKLFFMFNDMLEKQGIITHKGTIVDATFVDAPRQRNGREYKQIKNGETPEEWGDNPNVIAHKDPDARWTKKANEMHYGYKNHVKVDADSKIILEFRTTAANVHDSQVFTEFFDETDQSAYADGAYAGQKIPEHIENRVCEKGYKNRPLTEEQKHQNREKSKIRCRIEHVFGFMTISMHGLTIRTIGLKRASFQIGLTNLVYNICRYAILKKLPSYAG